MDFDDACFMLAMVILLALVLVTPTPVRYFFAGAELIVIAIYSWGQRR